VMIELRRRKRNWFRIRDAESDEGMQTARNADHHILTRMTAHQAGQPTIDDKPPMFK
jgi:hypothetical protein